MNLEVRSAGRKKTCFPRILILLPKFDRSKRSRGFSDFLPSDLNPKKISLLFAFRFRAFDRPIVCHWPLVPGSGPEGDFLPLIVLILAGYSPRQHSLG